jgi:hypothetical protein
MGVMKRFYSFADVSNPLHTNASMQNKAPTKGSTSGAVDAAEQLELFAVPRPPKGTKHAMARGKLPTKNKHSSKPPAAPGRKGNKGKVPPPPTRTFTHATDDGASSIAAVQVTNGNFVSASVGRNKAGGLEKKQSFFL